MPVEQIRRRSRYMLRVLEWNDAKARYPNVWHAGMPLHVLAYDTVAGRLRLGDLVAVYYPVSSRHPDRSARFVGLSRVTGLRRGHAENLCWVDLETAHRFKSPLDFGAAPRRVFLCCDPGWPTHDVALFEQVFEAAVAQGFVPDPADVVEAAAEPRAAEPEIEPDEGGQESEPDAEPAAEAASRPSPPRVPAHDDARRFAGVDYSGDMRDPREGTWLAVVRLEGDALRVVRLEATGRHGLHRALRDPDPELMRAEAIGCDFPFGVPQAFAESILGEPFPEEGWWALARKFERTSYPDYLVALQEFRDAHGEVKRVTDDLAGAFSPLHRVNPDLGPMTYHGIRMIAEERSRYAVRPFERAQGRLLLEVYPGGSARRLALEPEVARVDRVAAILKALAEVETLPVRLDGPFLARCRGRRDALDAVLAARCAAQAVLSGETERAVDGLASGGGDRVAVEGWIYGVVPVPEPATEG